MHAIVIPFRGPGTGKSRLAAGLSDTARRQVARAMFQHVLNVACRTAGARNVVVVTSSPTAREIARRVGASVLRETRAGHNEAVAQACSFLRTKGALTATVVSADLPLLTRNDIEALTRCARGGEIGVAPDRAGEGTNAIAVPLSLRFEFHFGAGSRTRHVRQALKQGARARLVRQAGLAADVDTPEDLALLADPSALATIPVVDAVFRGTP